MAKSLKADVFTGNLRKWPQVMRVFRVEKDRDRIAREKISQERQGYHSETYEQGRQHGDKRDCRIKVVSERAPAVDVLKLAPGCSLRTKTTYYGQTGR